MSSGSKRPVYLLVALLAAAAVIAVVLLRGLGAGPMQEPARASSDAGPVVGRGDLGAVSPVAAPAARRADRLPNVAARGAPDSPRPRTLEPRLARPRRLAPVASGRPTPTAPVTLDTPAVSAALQAVKPAVDRCYEQGHKRDPKLAGTATFRFTVVVSGGRGQIHSSALRSSDFKDPRVENCLLGALNGVSFDAPGPDGRRTLDFPILLGPVGRRP